MKNSSSNSGRDKNAVFYALLTKKLLEIEKFRWLHNLWIAVLCIIAVRLCIENFFEFEDQFHAAFCICLLIAFV